MSSWHQHHATGVYGECCSGDCSSSDSCHYNWDRHGCPHNPVFNRFVTVGSIKYGVRVGAVSPPPPGARYRSTAAAVAASETMPGVGVLHQHHYHHLYETCTATPTPMQTDKECCCNVVNLPWTRSVASVSRIPLLEDKQQLSINSCGIFSSVNSADIANGYASCSSLPFAERECKQRIKSQLDDTTYSETATASVSTLMTTADTSAPTFAATEVVSGYDRNSVYRLRSSWSHPPQLGLRSCVAATEQVRFSSSTATQLFLRRHRALVRSRSDAEANIHIHVDTDETIALPNELDTRQDTLDRLHRFRFGGNRGNVRGKKFRSEDKSERFRELTDRLKSATHLPPLSTSVPPSQKNAIHQSQQYSHVTPLQYQKLTSSSNHPSHSTTIREANMSTNGSQVDTVGPVPPPRTRHSVGSNSSRISTPIVTSSPSAGSSSHLPSPSQSRINMHNKPPFESNVLLSESLTKVDSNTKRTVPLRSASFSLVDFSADGKYIRNRTSASDIKENSNVYRSDLSSRGAVTLPRKKENQLRHLHVSSPISKIEYSDLDTETNLEKLCERLSQENVSDNSEFSKSDQSQKHTTTDNIEASKQKLRISDASAGSSVSSASVSASTEEKKRDRSRRRKGMYISQWPDQRASVMLAYAQEEIASSVGETVTSLKPRSDECYVNTLSNSMYEAVSSEHIVKNQTQPTEEEAKSETIDPAIFKRIDSFSEGENDPTERRPLTPVPSLNLKQDDLLSPILSSFDMSDFENKSSGCNDSLSPETPRRYSKRPLRGPYGQMLEAEMKRPDTNKTFSKQNYSNALKFLDDLANTNTSTSNVASSMISLVSENPSNTKVKGRLRGITNHSLDDSNLKSSHMPETSVFNIPSPNCKTGGDILLSAPTSIPGFEDLEPGQRSIFSCHQRTTSSPSNLEANTFPNCSDRAASAEPSTDFLCDLVRTSSEQISIPAATDDTRTHIVVELYETERSYVESLQILVMKYLEPLKSAENSLLVDAALVDEIFYQVPTLLEYHRGFLEELKKRLEHWDVKQKIGDIFLELSKPAVVETYTSFINNWKRAKEVIKTTSQAKPAFARFLEAMAREHKGKLALDSLLIKPVQKFPKYELLIQRLIKHTDSAHPDYILLLEAQKEIHENLIKINCTERETLEFEQQQQNLRELENLVEGLVNLVTADRIYLRHDLITMTTGQGTRKERALFLFSDLLVITSIKRRSGTIKKPTGNCPGSVASTLDANKYKLLMRISLDDLEIMKGKDENVRRVMLEIENLQEDISALNQVNELIWSLHCPKAQLEDVVRDMFISLNRQLTEQQNSDSQLSYLDLTLNTPNGVEHLSIVFSQPEKRVSWEETFNDAKQKLAISVDRRPSPEFLAPVPIRKTRAGLQFTCAAPTLTSASNGVRDVWVCNSDGYVGQVCVLSLHPEPTVTSCNGVCNARILCIASVPAGSNSARSTRKIPTTNTDDDENHSTNIQLDSSSSSADEEDSERDEYVQNKRIGSSLNREKSAEIASTDSSDDMDNQQPTMWLGTEDGCIHVYNCNDNIRIKKNKIRLQHGSSILCIIYLDHRVFVSLTNGDVTIYCRDQNGGWNTSCPITVSVSSTMMPVNKMLPNSGKLWCSCNNIIKIFNIHSLTVEHTFQTNSDQNKPITCMVMSGLAVWLSLHNSAVIKCFHSLTYDFLCEVNMAPAVTKMLTSCDDIIRQHKAACLRVTSLLACKDLLWVGTSAGVLLTMPLPHITTSTTKISMIPSISGVPHGHTGHVRFLTCMESPHASIAMANAGSGCAPADQYTNSKLLVISGGDGYEDFRSSNMSDVAGREDSTNHLLLWHV